MVRTPRAGLCTVMFDPIYKFIFIKNTKVAGTSVFLSLGKFCPENVTLASAMVRPLTPCCIFPSHASKPLV